MVWQAESVQFIVFSATPETYHAAEVWEALAGGRPSSFQPIQGFPGASQASGTIRGFGATLQMLPGRSTFVLTPNPDLGLDATPSIPDAKHAVGVGLPLGQLLADHVAGAVRLALVVDANQSVPTPSEAADMVIGEAHLRDLPSGVSDLSFQFGRRLRSRLGDYGLNRLCRWHTASKQLIEFAAPMVMGASLVPTVTKEEHLAGLFIDVNLVPFMAPIPFELKSPLFEELAEEVALLLDDAYARLSN